jgi:hypothetical protein
MDQLDQNGNVFLTVKRIAIVFKFLRSSTALAIRRLSDGKTANWRSPEGCDENGLAA